MNIKRTFFKVRNVFFLYFIYYEATKQQFGRCHIGGGSRHCALLPTDNLVQIEEEEAPEGSGGKFDSARRSTPKLRFHFNPLNKRAGHLDELFHDMDRYVLVLSFCQRDDGQSKDCKFAPCKLGCYFSFSLTFTPPNS